MKLYAKTLSLLASLTTITVVASNLSFLRRAETCRQRASSTVAHVWPLAGPGLGAALALTHP